MTSAYGFIQHLRARCRHVSLQSDCLSSLVFAFVFWRTTGKWICPTSGLPRWELNLSSASLYDEAWTVSLIHFNSRTHKRSNNPFAVRECNAHFTVMCNPLFRTRAYPKNKVRQCWRHKKTGTKKKGNKKRKKNSPLCQHQARLRLHQAIFDFFLQGTGWRLKGWTNGVAKCPLRATVP